MCGSRESGVGSRESGVGVSVAGVSDNPNGLEIAWSAALYATDCRSTFAITTDGSARVFSWGPL